MAHFRIALIARLDRLITSSSDAKLVMAFSSCLFRVILEEPWRCVDDRSHYAFGPKATFDVLLFYGLTILLSFAPNALRITNPNQF